MKTRRLIESIAAATLGFGVVIATGMIWLEKDPRARVDGTFAAKVETDTTLNRFITTKFRCPRQLRVVIFSKEGQPRTGLRFLNPETELPRCEEMLSEGEQVVVSDNFDLHVGRPSKKIEEIYWPSASAYNQMRWR